MGIYNKSTIQMVLDLVNQANPSLPVPLDPSTTVAGGTPTAITPVGGAIQDTTLTLQPSLASGYVGLLKPTYRRLDVGVLFRGITLEIIKYSSAATNASPYTLYQLLNDINLKFGLNLQQSDVVNVAFPSGAGDGKGTGGSGVRSVLSTLTIASTCLAFEGSCAVRWTQGPKDLGVILTSANIAGRAFPDNSINTATRDGRRIVTMDTYGYDFTAMVNQIKATPGGQWGNFLGLAAGQANTQPSWNICCAYINQFAGTQYLFAAGTGAPWSVQGLRVTDYALPNTAALPEADSANYNACLLIVWNNGWGVGRMLLHHNV